MTHLKQGDKPRKCNCLCHFKKPPTPEEYAISSYYGCTHCRVSQGDKQKKVKGDWSFLKEPLPSTLTSPKDRQEREFKKMGKIINKAWKDAESGKYNCRACGASPGTEHKDDCKWLKKQRTPNFISKGECCCDCHEGKELLGMCCECKKNMTNMKKDTAEWEKDFDNKFTEPFGLSSSPSRSEKEWDKIKEYGLRLKDEYNIEGMKSFIRKLLSSQRQQMLEKVEKTIEDYFKGLILIPNPQATKNSLVVKVRKALQKI